MFKKILTSAILFLALTAPSGVGAQVVSQNQLINKPYGVGVIVSTTTGNSGKLEAVATSSLNISTTNIVEGTKLFFTNARAIAATLTGYVSGAGTISATDSILSAIQKLNGNIAALVTGVSSVGGTYPIISSGGANPVISTAFGTTTANTFSQTQTFSVIPVFSTVGAGTINSTSVGTFYNTTTSTPTVSAPITYSGTLGQFISGVSGAFGCTNASAGVTGCLTGADYNTFNGKESVLTFSAPLRRISNTIDWTGLATTSQPTSSQLLTSNGSAGVYGTATSTLTASSPLTGSFLQVGSGGALGCQTASGSQAGCLSSTDFNTFNGKQAAGSYITALTGDVTASGPGSVASTLATVNGNVGSFTNANITVNGKGLITAASNGTGGGSGVGTIATSSLETAGQVAVFSTTSGYPARQYSVPTSTPTVTGPITYSGTLGSFIGGSSGAFGCATCALTTRAINTTYPLQGGGDLSADRTLTLAFGTTTSNIWAQNQTFTNGLILTGTSSPNYTQGRLVYDTLNESPTFFNNDSNISLQIGQEEWTRVWNGTGSTITNGSAVYTSGSHGILPSVSLSDASASDKIVTMGLATEDIANNATGTITTLGVVHGINTLAFTAGSNVYVSAVTPGALTSTAPISPNYRYRVGVVTVSDATAGAIQVTPTTAAIGNGTAGQFLGINTAVKQAFLGFSYPLLSTGTGVSLAFGTTTANTWSLLQQFSNASTTQLSVTNKLYVGSTATTTIDSAGNLVIPSGSSFTNTGRTDGCATWASAVLTSTGIACGSGGSGITALGSGYATTTGLTITHSTSTLSFNGLTFGQTITVPNISALLFTPTVTGTLNNAGLTNSTISGVALGGTLAALTATNASLTFSGSYDGTTARTVGLNVSNPNIWTGLQWFGNATSSLFSVENTAFFGGTSTTTIDVAGNVVIPSAASLTLTGLGTAAGAFLAVNASGQIIATTTPSGSASFANPSALVGLTAVNGSASTAMRSDAAPALDQSIIPTWTGLHTFNTSPSIGINTNGILLGNATWIYASSTNRDTLLGVSAGGTNATTSASSGFNTAIGFSSQGKITTGMRNTSLGASTMSSNTTNSDNTAIGYNTLNAASGSFNTVVGSSAGTGITGSDNTVVGGASGLVTSGIQNTTLGRQAGANIGTANDNVLIGYIAGNSLFGAANVIIGSQAGSSIGAAIASNIFIGANSGRSMSAGSFNIALGTNVTLPALSSSAQLNIGNVIYGSTLYSGSTVSSYPVVNGRIGIGTTTPYAKLSIQAMLGETNNTLFAVASSSAAATTTLFAVDRVGHIITGGTAPTANSCAGFAVTGDDATGIVTFTAASACSITFANAYLNTPVCMVNPTTNILTTITTISTTGFAITSATNISSFRYICQVHQ